MEKDTSKIIEELGLTNDFQVFYSENEKYMTSGPLAQFLNEIIEKKGLLKADVIRKSEICEIYAYQIFRGTKRPDRKKLLALCIGMGLGIDEVQSLLKKSGYPPLYAKNPFDCVVTYAFSNGFSVPQTNELLFKYDLETLN